MQASTLPAPAAKPISKNEPQLAGVPGTLLQHGIEERPDGGLIRVWKPGPITKPDGSATGYSVGRRGELRHTFPQFKGSKKNRLRLKKRIQLALDTTPPVGYRELTQLEELRALDLILSVESGKWSATSIVKVSVQDLRNNFPNWIRACRKVEAAAA